MRKYILSAVLLTAVSAVTAQTSIDFSYNYDNAEPTWYGTKLKEVYDVAIRIDNPGLTGSKVTRISVPMPGEASQYSGPSGWLTKELTLDGKVNVPDILTAHGNIADGYLTVDFAEPYTMTGEPVYIGYSFTVTGLTDDTRYPVAIVKGSDPDAFYLHSSRRQVKWASMIDKVSGGAQSAMTVVFSGDFGAVSLGGRLPATVFAKAGEPSSATLTVYNLGEAPVSEIDYSWSAAGKSGSGTCKLSAGEEILPLRSGRITAVLTDFPENGDYDLEITLDKVNGVANNNVAATSTSLLAVVEEIPVNRPLVEEFTGLWCGWCPYGYIMLETLFDEHPDIFVATAWHNSDPMAITNAYPVAIDGFPSASINRGAAIHPAYMEEPWLEATKATVPVSVNVGIAFTDSSKKSLKADASLVFYENNDNADYRIGYTLVEDGMSDPNWAQANNLRGDTDVPEGKYWDLFTKGTNPMRGLEFNDVVVACPEQYGFKGSVPEKLSMRQKVEHSYTFDISSLVNVSGEPVVQNPERLRVVAMVINSATGEVLNCNTSTYADGQARPTVVGAIDAEAEVTSTEYYDLTGRRISNPSKGIYIKVDRMSDGSSVSSRRVIR